MKKFLLMLVAVVGLTLWAAPKSEAHISFSIGVGGFYPYASYYPAYGYPYYYGPGYGYYSSGYYPRYYRRGYYYGPRRAYYYRGRRFYRRGYYARR